MTSQSLFLFFPLLARCLGQENPCEDISLGSCIVEEESILNTYSAPPDKCSKLCDVNLTCMFWRSRWDGTLCYLLTSDYQQDCGSFAGAINWIDCNQGPDSCYAYSDDDCVYTGDRMEAEEPFPEAVTSIEGCRLWAEVYSSVGAAFFHYNSTSEECHLYRTLDAECQAVGGPKAAPGFDQCSEKTTTTSPFVPTTTTTTTTTTSVSEPTNGILVIGGINYAASLSVEFWSAADPEQGSCVLNDYPREMWDGPTVNLVSGHLVACYEDTCEIYREGSWQHLQDTTASRTLHSSATREDAVLLIGGYYSYSTEWIAVDGSAAKPGPFTVRHGNRHCTIQLSDDIIVVTGGWQTEAFVTEYHLEDGTETALTPLGQPRRAHACGVYQDADGQQVLIVTGGGDGSSYSYLSSTEVAINIGGGSQLEWRETGRLPTPRALLRAAVIENHIYVTGGDNGGDNSLTEILRWDPSSESWQQVGNLGVGRDGVAAVAIPSSIIESECSTMFLK